MRQSLSAVTLLLVGVATLGTGPGTAVAGSAAGDPVDEPRCGEVRVTITGTAEDDVLVGTAGRDVIDALGGDDRVDGRGGGDVICGGPGRDVVVGGPGDDRLFDGGGASADVLRGGDGDDVLRAFAGRDRVEMGAGDDRLLTTSAAPPVVRAGTGDDEVALTLLTTVRGLDVRFGDSARGDEATLYGMRMRGRGDLSWDLRTGRVTGLDGRTGHFQRARRINVSWMQTDIRVRGSALGEELTSFPGDDGRATFVAGAGPDAFDGSAEPDTFDGGPGRDTYIDDTGGPNRCRSVERDPRNSCR